MINMSFELIRLSGEGFLSHRYMIPSHDILRYWLLQIFQKQSYHFRKSYKLKEKAIIIRLHALKYYISTIEVLSIDSLFTLQFLGVCLLFPNNAISFETFLTFILTIFW